MIKEQTTTVEEMQSLLSKYRSVDPKYHDRVRYLLSITTNPPPVDKNFDPSRIKKVFRDMEKTLVEKSKYNFVLENLPKYGVESETNKSVVITYTALRDTFNQFGKLDDIQIVNGSGTVYMKFRKINDAVTTHKLVNKMQIGNNIVNTRVV